MNDEQKLDFILQNLLNCKHPVNLSELPFVNKVFEYDEFKRLIIELVSSGYVYQEASIYGDGAPDTLYIITQKGIRLIDSGGMDKRKSKELRNRNKRNFIAWFTLSNTAAVTLFAGLTIYTSCDKRDKEQMQKTINQQAHFIDSVLVAPSVVPSRCKGDE